MGRRKRRYLLVGLAALLLLVCLALWAWNRGRATPTAVVRRGTIHGRVIAPGQVVSEREALLMAGVSGPVTELRVKVGDEVVTGTVLLTIGAESQRLQVEIATLELQSARLRLAEAEEGPLPEEVAAAEADLRLAQAQLDALLRGPRQEELTIARQQVVQAEAALSAGESGSAAAVEMARLRWEQAANELRDVQDAYSRIYWENESLRRRGVVLSQAQVDAESAAWRQVENAQAALEQTRLAYEQALRDREAQLTTARARLTEARARLQELVVGAGSEELAAAEAQLARAQAALARLRRNSREVELRRLEVRRAELALEQARAELERATVRAPFAGTVVEVLVREGELVGVYASLLRLADLNRLYVRAQVDEIDVGKVAPGQPVTVTLDAFPGQPLLGVVEAIAPAVTLDRGSATYLTRIAVHQPLELSLRLGMAASVTIVTQERRDVLLVPRTAVERVGERNYVTVLRGSRRQRVPVTLGVTDASFCEILSGLEEGERVLLGR
ncbi:MAG: efflux RND transporter periplasmic adaptor subunit [Chloroflexia bacterium]